MFYQDISVIVKFLLGKVSDNGIITEGLFTLTHLMVLFNDQVIRCQLTKDATRDPTNEAEEKIKLFLAVLDNVEVFIEVSSKKVLGNVKKFIVIFVIQAIKYIRRSFFIPQTYEP
jgi:Peroxisomal membrane protein (Pex16)